MTGAGARPASRAVTKTIAIEKQHTRRIDADRFDARQSVGHKGDERRGDSTRRRQDPRHRPASANTRLSANTWRTILPRPAPSAARTASSPRRASPRINNRFATFALAISSTSPTAANSASMAVRTSPTTTSANGRTTGTRPRGVTGWRIGVQPLGQRRDLARRLLERDAGTKPANQVDLAACGITKWTTRRHRARGPPHFNASRVVEIRRHHTDDREGAASLSDHSPPDHVA